MKALPPRGLSALAVEHVLVGMLWPDAEGGVGWQRWGGGCPCPPAAKALLLLCYQQMGLWSQALGCSHGIWHEEHRVQTLQGGRVGWKWDRVSALHLNCFAVVTVVLFF